MPRKGNLGGTLQPSVYLICPSVCATVKLFVVCAGRSARYMESVGSLLTSYSISVNRKFLDFNSASKKTRIGSQSGGKVYRSEKKTAWLILIRSLGLYVTYETMLPEENYIDSHSKWTYPDKEHIEIIRMTESQDVLWMKNVIWALWFFFKSPTDVNTKNAFYPKTYGPWICGRYGKGKAIFAHAENDIELTYFVASVFIFHV